MIYLCIIRKQYACRAINASL